MHSQLSPPLITTVYIFVLFHDMTKQENMLVPKITYILTVTDIISHLYIPSYQQILYYHINDYDDDDNDTDNNLSKDKK